VNFISVLELIHFHLLHCDLSADEESLNSSWSQIMEVLNILLSSLKYAHHIIYGQDSLFIVMAFSF